MKIEIEVDPDLAIRAELARKFLDSMIHLLADRENGRISEAEFLRTWHRIRDVVSGLIDWQIINEIEGDLRSSPALRPAVTSNRSMGQNNTHAPKRRTGT